MSNDLWDELKKEFTTITNRVAYAPDVAFATLRGLTWDQFVEGKSYAQVSREIKEYAEMVEKRINQTNR
jgi:hypothetical protein